MSFDIQQIDKQSGIATKEVNCTDYTIQLLPATSGLAMSLEISKLLAPSVGAGLDGFGHDELLHGKATTFSGVAKLLATQLGTVDVSGMVKALLNNLEADGKKVNFDTHFRGNYGDLIQLIEFALKENFESFFTESGLKTRLTEVIQSLSVQPAELEELLEP